MQFTKTLTNYIGSISQIGGIKHYRLADGKAKGMDIYEFNNGNGIVFDVIADRAMDICHFSYKGSPVSYISKSGIVSPTYYNREGYEWLGGFFAGLFTTCGVINAGEPSEYGGRKYGLHGDISNTPAENISLKQEWVNDKYSMSISGQMRQGMMLFEDILFERTITCELGGNEICISDKIINEGNKEEPFMLAYHFNFGYPLINKDSELIIAKGEISAFSPDSESFIKDWDKFDTPLSGIESAYFHKFKKSSSNKASFLLINNSKNPQYAFELEYDAEILDICIQWRHYIKGEYCLAMQPSNSFLKGVGAEEENKTLKHIQPGEEIKNSLKIKVYGEEKDIKAAKKRILNI